LYFDRQRVEEMREINFWLIFVKMRVASFCDLFSREDEMKIASALILALALSLAAAQAYATMMCSCPTNCHCQFDGSCKCN
jgi:hypothetical protein